MLTGQAKTDYQRGYMRKRRSNEKAKHDPFPLDPTAVELLDPPESVHDVLARTPLAELEGRGGWVPNWRIEQGHNP